MAFVVLLRQAPLGGLLASAVATGWLFGGGSFLLGVFPPWLGLCSAPLLCLLPVLLALPVLPRQWVVEAFAGVGPRVRHGLGPSSFLEGVVWRCPDASGVRVGAWFLTGGCHPGYVGGIRVVRDVWLGTGSYPDEIQDLVSLDLHIEGGGCQLVVVLLSGVHGGAPTESCTLKVLLELPFGSDLDGVIDVAPKDVFNSVPTFSLGKA